MKKKETKFILCKSENCEACARRAEWFCLSGNIFLVFFKGSLGIFSGSMGLVADAIHSCAALLDSIVSLFALNIGQKPPDDKYPYGYGMAEFISGVFLGIVLFIGAIYISFSSFSHLILHTPLEPPHFIALVAAIISISINEGLFRFAICAAKKVNSPALTAEAWNSRSDSLSSIPVILGVIGSHIGFPLLDPLAALFVGLLVGKIAFTLLDKNIKGLMDLSLNSKDLYKIKLLVMSVKNVHGIKSLKTRGIGRSHWVDLHVLLKGHVSINESDEIGNKIKDKILKKIKNLSNVHVVCTAK